MNVSKTVMIHVAVEILAFSYLYSLVNKKTKSLEVEIEEMREDYEKKIDDLYEKVEILKNALIQITRPRNESQTQQPMQQSQQNFVHPPQQTKKNVKQQQKPTETNKNTTFILPPMFMDNAFDFNTNEVKQAEVIEENEENNQEEKTEITDKEMEEIEQLIESSVE